MQDYSWSPAKPSGTANPLHTAVTCQVLPTVKRLCHNIFFSPKEDPNNKYEFKKFQKQIQLSWELNPVIQKQVVVLGQD